MSYIPDQQDVTDPTQETDWNSPSADPATEQSVQDLIASIPRQRMADLLAESRGVAPPADPNLVNVNDLNPGDQPQPGQELNTPWFHDPYTDHPWKDTKIAHLLKVLVPLGQGALAGYGPGGVGGGFQRQQQMQRTQQQMQWMGQREADLHAARQRGLTMVTVQDPRTGATYQVTQAQADKWNQASMLEGGRNARNANTVSGRGAAADQRTTATMAARGLQPDPQNEGSWIPIPREQLSEMTRSRLDLNDAHQEVLDAGKAYKEALTTAVPQKIELAKQRVGLAQQNLGMRAKEYQLHENAFSRDTYGTVDNQAVPGGATDKSGQPIGSTSPQAKAQARPARGITQNPPQGYSRIQTSDGIVHDIPRVNLSGAKQRDPNLKVMVQ